MVNPFQDCLTGDLDVNDMTMEERCSIAAR